MSSITGNDHRAREQRARRAAKRQGLALDKSPTRDRRAFEYGRFHVYDVATNGVVAGAWPCNYSMDLEDVEGFLAS